MNDLVVIGVHLAFGQHLNTNHNQARAAQRDRLQAVQAGTSQPVSTMS